MLGTGHPPLLGDNDGKLDLAVVNTAINQLGDVTILLGKGDGRFKLVNAYGVNNEVPEFVRAGDFNHDGKADIAVTLNNPGGVCVFLGKGDGSFQSPVFYAVEDGPQDLATADVNNDGNLDLVLDLPCGIDPSCVSNGVVGILLGSGDGTFKSVVNYAATGMDTARVGTGFFTNPETPDIVALNYNTSDITVFKGMGDGSFGAVKTFKVGSDPVSVGSGDLNGDGSDDLAVLNEIDRNVSVLLNRRTFSAPLHSPYGATPAPAVDWR